MYITLSSLLSTTLRDIIEGEEKWLEGKQSGLRGLEEEIKQKRQSDKC